MHLLSALGAAVLTVAVLIGVPATVSSGVAEVNANAQAQAQAQLRRGCVTKGEFRRVHRGMRRARVHRIFDTRGRFYDGHAGGYTRRYNPCWKTRKSYVVTFSTLRARHRVAEKGLFRLQGSGACPQPCI